MARTSRSLPCTRACRSPVAALFLIAAMQAGPAVAGKVYRCGNVFQDLPCVEQKVADARPLEPATPTREIPCVVNAKEPAGRNDVAICTNRPREPQPFSPTAVKSR